MLTSMPLYALAYIHVLAGVLHRLEKNCQTFLCGHADDRRVRNLLLGKTNVGLKLKGVWD